MLIFVSKYLAFVVNVTENLQTQWDELNGSPNVPFYHTFNLLGK